jgi:hypothetical protein
MSIEFWYICFVSHQVLTLTYAADCGRTFATHIQWLLRVGTLYSVVASFVLTLQPLGIVLIALWCFCSIFNIDFDVHYWLWKLSLQLITFYSCFYIHSVSKLLVSFFLLLSCVFWYSNHYGLYWCHCGVSIGYTWCDIWYQPSICCLVCYHTPTTLDCIDVHQRGVP